MVAICKAEGVRLSKLANKVYGIRRRVYVFVDIMNKILNFSIALKKNYNQRLFVTRVVDIVKDMMGSDSLTGIDIRFY